METLALVLTVLFGHPRAILAARVLAALGRLCPCGEGDAGCPVRHERVAGAIATVVVEQRDPDEAAILLLGTGLHETRFRVERQTRGGPAVTWWQLEVRPAEREALLADPVLAARRALSIARTCGGSMVGYASGRCASEDPVVLRTAAELRGSVRSARWALR